MKFNKQVFIFCLVGFLISCVLGSLAHFFYEWFGKSNIAALFFPVNESTWEHLKLVFFPVFLYFAAGMFFIKNKNILAACFICVLTAIVFIPLIFYSYTAVTGKSVLFVDILTFIIALLAGFTAAYFVMVNDYNEIFNIVSAAGLVVIIIFYMTLTFFPPHWFLFKDPISGGYGIIS